MNALIYAQPVGFSAFSPYAKEPNGLPPWFSAVFAGLLKRSSANNRFFAPDLALAMPTVSFDAQTFTFELQDNLKFSNGDLITSADVEFSLKMALAPAINKADYGKYAGFLDNSSVTPLSNTTFSITLLAPYSFAYDLMSFAIVPKSLYESGYNDCVRSGENCDFNKDDGSSSISAGPFKVSTLASDNIVLVKNEYWYSSSHVKTDAIYFAHIATKVEAITALSEDSAHILDPRYDIGLFELKGISGIKETFVGDPVTFEMAVNNLNPYFGTGMQIPKTLTLGPGNKTLGFDNARLLRHAMSAVMDRSTAVTQVLDGLAEPAATNMPSASFGWDPTVKPDTFNLTHAKEIMTDLGFNYTTLGTPNGNGSYLQYFFNITVLAPNTIESVYQFPSLYVSELSMLGIGVSEYVTLSWNDINSRVFQSSVNSWSFDDGGYDVLFFERSWDFNWNPGNLFSGDGSCSTGDCSNIYNFDLGENMTLLAQHVRDYLNELDFDVRLQKGSIVQQDMAYYLPTIGIMYTQSHWVWTDDVVGIDPLLLLTGNQQWDLVYRTSYYYPGPTEPRPSDPNTYPSTVLQTALLFLIVLLTARFFAKRPKE